MATIPELVHTACVPGPAAARAAARLMSVLADAPHRLPEVFHAAARVLPGEADRLLLPRMLVGITGAPGSGKSTLTDALIRAYRQRHPDYRLGVVAVDPSSPFTGGAVLGDRVRMMRHATDPLVFVRSMASRGHLGGLALGVKGVIRVMGLIGCEVVFIETVGVGQSEVEVAGVADLVMIVLAPGQGDSIQLLKAGLMEIGDLFVVNKADRPDAARLHADLVSMLRVAQADPSGHHADLSDGDLDQDLGGPLITRRPGAEIEPQTFLVSGEQGEGVENLVSGLDALVSTHGMGWQQHRRQMIVEEVREAVLEEAGRRVRQTLRGMSEGQEPVGAVLRGSLSVGDAAASVLAETCRRGQRRA